MDLASINGGALQSGHTDGSSSAATVPDQQIPDRRRVVDDAVQKILQSWKYSTPKKNLTKSVFI